MSQSPPPVAGPSSQPARADLLPQAVMEYLQQHGFDKALTTFQQELKGGAGGETGEKDGEGDDEGAGREEGKAGQAGREAIFRAPDPITLDYMVKRNIPQAMTLSASTMSNRITPEFIAQAKYIVEQLSNKVEGANAAANGEGLGSSAAFLDSSDRIEGYKRYRRWVDDGLDLWKPELDSLSFPLFAHTFLDMVEFGFLRAGRQFFEEFFPAHQAAHPNEISVLSSINATHHILVNPFTQRLRREKYTINMTRNTYGLLLQWLSGATLDEEWDMGLHSLAGRAKEAVRAVINSRIRIEVSNSAMPFDKAALASLGGLLSSVIPPNSGIEDFNTTYSLKLGPPQISDKLKDEVNRTIQEDSVAPNGHPSNGEEIRMNGESGPNGHDTNGDIDMGSPHPAGVNGDRGPGSPVKVEVKLEPDSTSDLVSPEPQETIPPQPQFFKMADVKREVEIIRDKRKMIRLGPDVIEGKVGSTSATILPSVLAFTVFDHGEGATSVQFSHDSSLMAIGSSESCIRLWSLKGEKLKAKSIDPLDGRLVEDDGLAMRKLIGHSGPVYSTSFDPLQGSGAPPRSLLSSSQDGTVRLWSMDTYSNVAVYRGHGRDAVWDVEWGPLGVYFATASRDRTARLWSSDRVTPLRMYTGHLSDVNCLKFHPNSLYLATGSSDNSCRLWDVQRGACIRLFLGHTDSIQTVAISPDGRTLASAGLDCNIYLWDLGSSRPIKKMTGHTAPIQSLSFSAESSLLLSGSQDCTVRCWDVKSPGGPKSSSSMRSGDGVYSGSAIGGDVSSRRLSGAIDLTGSTSGELPMGPGEMSSEDWGQTSDLLSTFRTKRTPIIKTHYTPRNLAMVAGCFVPPSKVQS